MFSPSVQIGLWETECKVCACLYKKTGSRLYILESVWCTRVHVIPCFTHLSPIPDNYDLLKNLNIVYYHINQSTKDKQDNHDRSEWSKHLTLFQMINLILYKENGDFLVHRMGVLISCNKIRCILNTDINFNSLICYIMLEIKEEKNITWCVSGWMDR